MGLEFAYGPIAAENMDLKSNENMWQDTMMQQDILIQRVGMSPDAFQQKGLVYGY